MFNLHINGVWDRMGLVICGNKNLTENSHLNVYFVGFWSHLVLDIISFKLSM